LQTICAPFEAAKAGETIELGVGIRQRLRQTRFRADAQARALAVSLVQEIVEILRQAALGDRLCNRLRRLRRRTSLDRRWAAVARRRSRRGTVRRDVRRWADPPRGGGNKPRRLARGVRR